MDIGIDGFKSAGGNEAIGLEMYQGKLMLRVWGNTESEDATLVVDLTEILEQKTTKQGA